MSLSSTLQHRVASLIAMAALLVLGLWIYLPGLGGPFLFDDNHNFVQNEFVHMTTLDSDGVLDAAFSSGDRFPYRGMSRLSFALNYYFSGGVFDPKAFKLTNVVIHLLNAMLVFALARLLLRQHANRFAYSPERVMWIAALCAGLWLLHPLQLTSVLYAVQRMTSLSAMFVFAGLLSYTYGRRAVQGGDSRGFVPMALGLCGGVLLGVLNKENAALLPFLAYVVHLAFFPSASLDALMRRRLRIFHLLFVGLPLLIAIIAIAWAWSGFVTAYELGREFSMGDRLLTQPRVLFFYLSLLLFPSLRRMSLHHDDLVFSTGLLSPPSTLVAIVVLVVLLGFALYKLRSGALWAFAVVFYLVALAMESSFLPLEMVYEHRNYLPSFALALLCAHFLVQFARRSTSPAVLATAVSLAVVLGLSVVTWARVGIWSNEILLMQYMSEQHPGSYRALAIKARMAGTQGRSTSEIFTAYANVAHANSHAVFPLIRMRRVVNAMQFHLVEGIIPSSPAPDAVETRWDSAVLYRDWQYLDGVAVALDQEIRRRLPLSPIVAETLAEFHQVRNCIARQLDLCVGLNDEFQGWLRVALTQSTIDAAVRGRILFELAVQYELDGDYDRAHAALIEANGQRSSGTAYLLRRVRLFAQQQKFAEAERLLLHIESVEGQPRADRSQARRLREMLADDFKRERAQRGERVAKSAR